MDKWQALQGFWESFGVDVYDESSVPDDAGFPRITYNPRTGSFEDGDQFMSASLWYYGTSWAAISQMADNIADYIGMGGTLVPYTGGAIWIKRGNPFAQRMSDPGDDKFRRVLLQIEAEFISAN